MSGGVGGGGATPPSTRFPFQRGEEGGRLSRVRAPPPIYPIGIWALTWAMVNPAPSPAASLALPEAAELTSSAAAILPKETRRVQLNALTGVRILAALLVIAFHYS